MAPPLEARGRSPHTPPAHDTLRPHELPTRTLPARMATDRARQCGMNGTKAPVYTPPLRHPASPA